MIFRSTHRHCVLAGMAALALGLAQPAGATHAGFLQLDHGNSAPGATTLSCAFDTVCFFALNTFAGTNVQGLRGEAGNISAGSTAGAGVQGIAGGAGGSGVYGLHTGGGNGVFGKTSSAGASGVYGENSAGGFGVAGRATPPAGFGTGVLAENTSSGYALRAHANNFIAVYATSDHPGHDGVGLWGLHNAPTGTGPGVRGTTFSNDAGGVGVTGIAAGTAQTEDYGTEGFNHNGVGVFGINNVTGPAYGAPGPEPGVRGQTNSGAANAKGVEGIVEPTSPGIGSAGVRGLNKGTGALGIGVRGEHNGAGNGVYGSVALSNVGAAGILGQVLGTGGGGVGVHGHHNGGGYGVYGNAAGAGGVGVAGNQGTPNGWAAFFFGRGHFTGTLTKGGGAFKIDHPLDPANKYLQHSFVESPDMKNVYDGMVRTNGDGFATVRLPSYFQALNRDFRYQLTIVGKVGWEVEARVWDELADNRFTIRTNEPNVKVSWQVTGIRKDRWADANRIKVEQAKPASDRGRYLNPELYGKPAAKNVLSLPPMKRR